MNKLSLKHFAISVKKERNEDYWGSFFFFLKYF